MRERGEEREGEREGGEGELLLQHRYVARAFIKANRLLSSRLW